MNYRLSRLFLNMGAVLEYYDYLTFVFLAKILAQVFFPHVEQGNVTINFLFFALGGAVMIVGGLGFGYLSDLWGRRKIILCMSIMMAVSSLSMGLMPYNLDVKVYLFLFFALRIIQALSFGGEIPCATTFAYELENDTKKNSRISHIFSAASLGSILATGVLSFLTFSLDMKDVCAWGWRIPFLVGGILGLLAFFLRRSLPETLLPNLAKNNVRDIFAESKIHFKHIAFLPFILFFPATLITVNLYFPVYISQHFKFTVDKIYFAQTISLIFSTGLAIVAGIFSDKKLIKKFYVFVLLSFLCAQPFFFQLLSNSSTLSLTSLMILWQFFITTSIVFAMFLILETLPMSIRATANGLIYNLTFFMASFVPILFSKFFSTHPNPHILFYIISITSFAALISIMKIK